jgi:hypothetical protein
MVYQGVFLGRARLPKLESEMQYQHRGFSLLEMLLATGTLAASLMMVIALGISVEGRSRKAHEVPVGVNVGENLMNQFIYGATSGTPAVIQAWFLSVPSVQTPWKSGSYTFNRVDFAYSLDYQNLLGGGVSGSNHLVLLQMRVTWQEGAQGIQHADLTRIVHEAD